MKRATHPDASAHSAATLAVDLRTDRMGESVALIARKREHRKREMFAHPCRNGLQE